MISKLANFIDKIRRWLDREYNYKRTVEEMRDRASKAIGQIQIPHIKASFPKITAEDLCASIDHQKLAMLILSDPDFDPTPLLHSMLVAYLKKHWSIHRDSELVKKYVEQCTTYESSLAFGLIHAYSNYSSVKDWVDHLTPKVLGKIHREK